MIMFVLYDDIVVCLVNFNFDFIEKLCLHYLIITNKDIKLNSENFSSVFVIKIGTFLIKYEGQVASKFLMVHKKK